MKYDCIIVGAGPMGLYCAYEFMTKAPDKKVLLIDRGHDIYNRKCPILMKKLDKCPVDRRGHAGCYPSCSITSGFGGAGAYSDGKFNITNEFGGWLGEYISDEQVLELINYVDQINLDHGADPVVTDPTTNAVREIEKKAIGVGLKLLRSKVRHLGTDQNILIMKKINETMKGKIEYKFKQKVVDLIIEDNVIKGVRLEKGEEIFADNVVLGVGREGAIWQQKLLEQYNVKFRNNQVDIGVRVETNDIVMEDINKNLYEGKFIYNTSVGTTVRTFCSNPSGHVVIENQDGVILVNGHAFRNEELSSQNTNFALLVSHEFAEPFNSPNDFASEIAKLANKLSNGGVIVQTFGDILKGRRSTPKRIKECFVRPTLPEAEPGDLGLVLPYNTMKSLIEMMHALDHITPGIASNHTLFYGVEAKFYSARPEVDASFQTAIKNLYVGGDGAGMTRGLAQAGANGVWIARNIIKKSQKE